MSFFSTLGNIATGGILGLLTKGNSKNKKDPYADFLNTIKPYLDKSQAISDETWGLARDELTKANSTLNIPLDFYKRLQNGDMTLDEVMQYFTNPEMNKNQDENQMILENFGVRGGRRAADISNEQVNRESNINSAYQNLKTQAPAALTNIGQIFGSMGSGLLGSSLEANNTGLQSMFNIENFRQADKERKAEIISSVIGAIGSAAGFIACVTGDTEVNTSVGKISINELFKTYETNNFRIKASKSEDRLVSVPILYIKETPSQDIWLIETTSGHKLRGTKNHCIVTSLEDYTEKPLEALTLDDKAIILVNGHVEELGIKSIKQLDEKESVYIMKLGDYENNYMFVTNGFLSIDDDIRLSKG
jgi:hypothetical protein